MKNLKRKLRSNRGASITFALLIFLVCAIVSGVVIVAASTAGGRMSGMKETDQRYFAATAAAHTLQEIFENGGNPVEVTYNPANVAGTAVADTTNVVLKTASEAVVSETTYAPEAISIPAPADSNVSCSVKPELKNGLLNFEITATGGTANINEGTYKLTIVFSPNVKKPNAGSSSSAKATVTWSLNSLSRGQASQRTGG